MGTTVGRRAEPRTSVGPGSGRVRIELSAAQVERVLEVCARSGGRTDLRARLPVVREAFAHGRAQLDDGRLSHSLLCGLLILAAMPSDGGYVSNAQIARMLGMNASTAHRYVSTLRAAGLLERDPATRHYRLA